MSMSSPISSNTENTPINTMRIDFKRTFPTWIMFIPVVRPNAISASRLYPITGTVDSKADRQEHQSPMIQTRRNGSVRRENEISAMSRSRSLNIFLVLCYGRVSYQMGARFHIQIQHRVRTFSHQGSLEHNRCINNNSNLLS